MAKILEEGPIRRMLREKGGILKRSPEEPEYPRELGWNSVDINAYVSKIRFNLKQKTITVLGKDGRIIWGVSEAP